MTSIPASEARKATVKLPWPHKHLSPNARVHWSKKAKEARRARHDAAACALEAGIRHIEAGRLLVKLIFCPPDRRHRDLDNMLASAKSLMDGIADVTGVDDSRWAISLYRDDPVKGGAIRVEVEALA